MSGLEETEAFLSSGVEMLAIQSAPPDANQEVEAPTEGPKLKKPEGSGRKGGVQRMKTVGLRVKKGVTPVITVGKRLKKGVFHIVFNSIGPGADVTSDFLTFLELMEHHDIGWAMAVLFFMFVPFFFKLAEFVVDLCRGKVKENNVVGQSISVYCPHI